MIAPAVRLMRKPDLRLLRSLPLLRSCPAEILAALQEAAGNVAFGADEDLFQAGDRLSEVIFLVDGQIGITRPRLVAGYDFVDVQLPVRVLCLPATLLGVPTYVGARALTFGRLITLPVTPVREMIGNHSKLAQSLFDCALREAHERSREVYDLKLRSTAQRLAQFLLELIEDPAEIPARIVLPFRKEFLAMKVGCTHENLSRAFAALRGIGIQTQQRVVIVSNIPGLREYALESGRPTMREKGRRRHLAAGVSDAHVIDDGTAKR
jgi:CRP/FNR family transcriptional activator FtrB